MITVNPFLKAGQEIHTSDILEFESFLGYKLPQDFTEFYLQYNGGTPKKDFYIDPSGEWDAFDIQVFEPIKYPLSDKQGMVIEDTYDLYVNKKKFLPDYLVPFAHNNTGDPYCINRLTGRICFFSIDDFDNLDEAIIYIAPDILSFVNGFVSEEEAYE